MEASIVGTRCYKMNRMHGTEGMTIKIYGKGEFSYRNALGGGGGSVIGIAIPDITSTP
jgi:hypothetical protein